MVGSAAIKQGRSANRKHTYFFFWPHYIHVPFFQKSRKMSQNLSSAAVMIGAVRVNPLYTSDT